MSKTNDYTAIGPLTGFIYQIYYFLYCLLKIQKEEIVSLEMIDDVGVESSGRHTYFQLKHSINSTSSTVKRMTERDTDVWKTLNMWVSIIKAKGNETLQRQWIADSEFVLISNKSKENNKFFELLNVYKKDDSKWGDLEKYVEEQAAKEPKDKCNGTEKKNIFLYTKNVNDYSLRKELLKQVSVEFKSDEELLTEINHEIRYGKHIPEQRVSDVCGMLKGNIMDSILTMKEISYTMESFDEAYGKLFCDMLNRKFVPLTRSVELPKNLMEQTFLKQLKDIDALDSKDYEKAITLTEQKLRFENDYRAAKNASGRYVQQQFEEDMHTEWKNIFEEENDGLTCKSNKQAKKKAGKEVLRKAKKIHLKYDQEDIGPTESNGCFYHFSDGDNPQIGWQCDWETLYNGKEWTIK